MASRTFQPVQALDKEIKLLFGLVTFGAAGVIAAGQTSYGFTVSKPGAAGLYRITLDDLWPELVGVALELVAAAARNGFFQVQAVDLVNKVIDIQYMQAGAAANATDGDKVFITLFFKNSNVTP